MIVLCYHAVDEDWVSALSVPPAAFTAHCKWLSSNRRVIGLTEAVQANERERVTRGTTVLTFDDGFSSLYDHALPILKQYRLPATVFLVAATLTAQGKAVDWVDYPPSYPLRTLNLDQIREMQHAGMTFGSHSWSHRNLTELSDHECRNDLSDSRELLEELLGQRVRFLAYPRGLHDARVRRLAEDVGYTHGFSLPESREPRGPYAFPRVGVYPHDTSATLRAKTSRWYVSARMSRGFPALRRATRLKYFRY